MIWLGTDNGLARFDGKKFRNYQVKDGIPDPEVLSLETDIEGRLWLSCFRKSPCYYKNGKFYNEQADTALNHIQFASARTTMFNDSATGTWFTGTDTMFYCWRSTNVLLYGSSIPIAAMCRIGNDMFALNRLAILHFNPNVGIVDTLIYFSDLDRPGKIFTLDGVGVSGNRLLYATSLGLWLFEWDGSQLRLIDQKKYPTGYVFVDSKGRFWLCNNLTGAICFDNNRKELSNPRYYLREYKITQMLEDRQGSYWFGTTGNGVFVLTPHNSQKFTQEEGLPLNNITALCRLKDGTIITGDEEGNISSIKNGVINSKPLIRALEYGYNKVRHITQLDSNSQLIIADLGVFIRSIKGTRQISARASAKAAVILDSVLWAGDASWLTTLDLNSKQVKMILRRRVTALAADRSKTLWMASVDGLYSGRDSFSTNLATRFPLLKCRITDLELINADELLISTSDAGLLHARIRNGDILSVKPLPFDKSSNPPLIRSIFQDSSGRIWLATPQGVYWVTTDGKKGKISTFQGLVDNDVNAVVVYDDTLWAATRYGLGVLQLKKTTEKTKFSVCITALRYRLGRELITKELYGLPPSSLDIVLPRNAGMVEFSLAALEYTNAGTSFDIRERHGLLPWYLCTLPNLIRWISSPENNARVVHLEESDLSMGINPPPGVYTFTVEAHTENNIYSRNYAAISITILPQWYQVLWVWVALISIILAALWRYLHTFTKVRELDSAVSNLQLQALQAQINPHFLGNSINAIQQFFYPPNPEKASEYVGILTDLLRKTMAFSEHHFITFGEELSYDREYLQLIELRYGEHFHFYITGAEQIPAETAFPCMLLQPLLENATKHGLSPDSRSEVGLHFEKQGDVLVCRIEDNGVGINHTKYKQKTIEHESRGFEILYKKIDTLNRLYHLDLRLEIRDRSETPQEGRGTLALLQFKPSRVPGPRLSAARRNTFAP